MDGTRRAESLRPFSCAPCTKRGAARASLQGPRPAKAGTACPAAQIIDHQRLTSLRVVRRTVPPSQRRAWLRPTPPPSEHADASRSRNAPAAIPRGDSPACDPWRGDNPRRISAPGGCRPDHPLVAAGAAGHERRARSRRAESAVVGRSQVRRCARGSSDSANHPTGCSDRLSSLAELRVGTIPVTEPSSRSVTTRRR